MSSLDPEDIEREAREARHKEFVKANKKEREALHKKCEEHVRYWNEESPKARSQLQSSKEQQEREKHAEKFTVKELRTR